MTAYRNVMQRNWKDKYYPIKINQIALKLILYLVNVGMSNKIQRE